jgi:integrase/recombinase XerD
MHNEKMIKVGKNNVRKYAYDIAKHWLGKEKTMSHQAKVFTDEEVERVLKFTESTKHCLRNRTLVLTSFQSGMRAKELASLRYKDVVNADGTIKSEIRLSAEQTKGSDSRTVYINTKLQKDLLSYVNGTHFRSGDDKFFQTQKSNSKVGFSPNTLCQFFHYLYKQAGIEDGASSHSGRRTLATKLCERGTNLRLVMEVLGHKNLSTTQKYLSVNVNLLKQAIELV